MNLHCLHAEPAAWLGEALERFEQQFDYPLGPDQRFRISHGRSYLPFFQAMGRACVLVAESAGEVLGTLARVERQIELNGANKLVHYLCDLKVTSTARGSRVLLRLMQETRCQIEATCSRSCYAIVMGGTGRMPTDYTGRVGIPSFQKLGEIVVLRLSAGQWQELQSPNLTPRPPIHISSSQHSLRSLMTPVHLRIADASAVLEDTRRGKCLWLEDGSELLSAHVSCFQYDNPVSGAAMLKAALSKACEAGYPAVFVAVPRAAWRGLHPHLRGVQIQEADATVFGHDFPNDHDWWVNTAEI